MKRLFLFSFCTILIIDNLSSQIDVTHGEIKKTLQCEINEWGSDNTVFDTNYFFCKTVESEDNTFFFQVMEYNKRGFIFDTTVFVELGNGKKMLKKEPIPIQYSDPLRINNDAITRWKLILFEKDDLSRYYVWNNEFNPRGIIKMQDDSNQCYLLEKNKYCYIDSLQHLVEGIEDTNENYKSSDTIQNLMVGNVKISIIKVGTEYEVLFSKRQSWVKWVLVGEDVQVANTGYNTFLITVTTCKPNYLKLFFRIANNGDLIYYYEETMSFFNRKSDKWEYFTFISYHENIKPWIVKETLEPSGTTKHVNE